jgi:hypothetical protein
MVCGLVLLGLGGTARAADVTVQPAADSSFVVTNAGASPLLKVQASGQGQVLLPGLPAAPVQAQALCFGAGGVLGGCALTPGGTGFTDNGDGTVTDNKTGLMWEKKTGTVGAAVFCTSTTCADPHDVNNLYTWSAGGTAADGTVFTQFLEGVNGRLCGATLPISPPYPPFTCPKLGGHSDWRLPLLSELQTIVDTSATGCGTGSPCINSAFGLTVPSDYWSASTFASSPGVAWDVFFLNGFSGFVSKAGNLYVRAVRGGL